MTVQNDFSYVNNHNPPGRVSAGSVVGTTFRQVYLANKPNFVRSIRETVGATLSRVRNEFVDQAPNDDVWGDDFNKRVTDNLRQRIKNLKDPLNRCLPRDKEKTLAEFRVVCPLLNFNFTELSRAYKGFRGLYQYIELPYLNLIRNEDHDWLTTVDRLMGDPGNFQMILEGTSGSYWVKDETGRRVAIFKFNDEVTGQPANPKNPFEGGADSEEAAEREFAAWVIGGNFVGVSEAHVVDVFHGGKRRRGGLIKFVEADGTLHDLYLSFLENYFKQAGISSDNKIFGRTGEDAEELMNSLVHDPKVIWNYQQGHYKAHTEIAGRFGKVIFKIAILDILTGNPDRSMKNILYKKDGDTGDISLVPIDHNFAFPEEETPYSISPFWMGVPQFMSGSLDAESRRYIENLDLEVLAKQLRSFGLSERRVEGVWLRGLLLKKGVEAGLSLFEIAQMMTIERVEMKRFEPTFRSCLLDIIIGANEVLEKEEIPKEMRFQRTLEVFEPLLDRAISEKKKQIERQGVSNQAQYAKAINEALERNDYSRFESLYGGVQRRAMKR